MQNERDLQSDLFPNFFDRYPQDLFPTEQPIDEEPLYVNAKQYFRILKRRVARTRLEELHRLSRQRKPYLHESRHKHAMRRPRGPGGRFLTAEEIAAQKLAAGDHDMDDENIQLSPEPSPPAPGPSFMQPMINLDYHRQHQIQNPTPPPPPPPVFPPQPQQQHLHNHNHHHPSKSINLSSPYPPPVQMHHVPHPHAHARHHHSSFSYQLYPDPMAQTANLEMQRRTEEMIQFGTSGPSSS
ncbi:hypothetical protein M413DRAFT_24434 [Hebeloma cylindrosporum]|uniref:Transcriptional activator HAP2 n=1 Tax=Hebeloma cylindrosporum TaxID=76867 RepID=A0A0C3CM62_HEBCY|nr:hypothetical protein M413DRAFT_24434 [Hebeloma cylindrosporum h7]